MYARMKTVPVPPTLAPRIGQCVASLENRGESLLAEHSQADFLVPPKQPGSPPPLHGRLPGCPDRVSGGVRLLMSVSDNWGTPFLAPVRNGSEGDGCGASTERIGNTLSVTILPSRQAARIALPP